MRILIIVLSLVLASCHEPKNPKAYQIIVTPEKEYYTTFYNVYLGKGCIDFIAYDGDDSAYVQVCQPWDVKPNPDYQK